MNATEVLRAALNEAANDILETEDISKANRAAIVDALAVCGPDLAGHAWAYWEPDGLTVEAERQIARVLDPFVHENTPRKHQKQPAPQRTNASGVDLAGLVIAAVKALADSDGVASYTQVKEWCVARGASDGGALDRRYKGAGEASSATTSDADSRLYAQGVGSNYRGDPPPPVAERWFTLG